MNRLAFGFSENDIKKIKPEKLRIRWRNDLYSVKEEIKMSGLSDIEWAKNVSLEEPVEVDFSEDLEMGYKRGFYLQDGHHRYYAAKTLKKSLKVNLTIKIPPVKEISNLGYDQLHICIFNQVKNS